MFVQVLVFYILTWFCLVLLGGLQQASGVLPAEIGLAQWGPGLAGFLMVLIFRKPGLKLTFLSKGTPSLRYLAAALIPVGVSLVVLLVSMPLTIESSPSSYNSLPLVLLWMPLGALGEEIGWRGYLHKRLDGRLRGIVSSVIVGLLWMPIHVHFFAEGPLFLFFFALLLIAYSVVIYALVQDSGFSILVATFFHFAVNLSNLLFLDKLYDTTFMAVNALVWVVVAAVVVGMKKEIFIAQKQ